MEFSVRHLQSVFGQKRDNRSTCHLFSQDSDITSRSVSNCSTSTTKLVCWTTSPMILLALFKSLMVSLICYVCFVWQWFAVRLSVIQPCANTLCQQNNYYRYCLYIMTTNSFHNILRFDWSIERVAVGKLVMSLALKTCANRWAVRCLVNNVLLFPVEYR